MPLLLAFLLGAGWGAYRARRAGLPRPDVIHRALVHGLAFALLTLLIMALSGMLT